MKGSIHNLFRPLAVRCCVLAAGLILCTSCGQPPCSPVSMELSGDLKVHDPAIIRQDDTYYVFSTGGFGRGGMLPIRCSTDLINWEYCGSVFDRLPDWATAEVPGTRSIWAPDIAFFNDRYHLYYSVSTFGKNHSAIGLATNKTLDPESPDYEWIDRGLVVRSTRGDNFNAIDGNIAIEDDDNIWLCWGSFWDGIKMKRIDPATGKPDPQDETLYSLASRPDTNAIEAPFIIRHDGYWYLFVSFDICCRGADSTYKIMVGRSKQITGPYLDRSNVPMRDGGGTLVLQATTENWKGPGHCSVLQAGPDDYLVFHAYNGQTGRSALKIAPICWNKGWPTVAELP